MKKLLTLLLAALLALSCVPAALAEAQPDTFTAFINVGADTAVEGNEVVEWFENLANVKFDFVVSTGNEMLTLLVSSGDYPEIFLTNFSNNDIVYYGVESQSSPRPVPSTSSTPSSNTRNDESTAPR